MFRLKYNYGTNVSSGSYTGSQSASRAESKATAVESQVKRLQADLARSLMISEALWELLRDRAKLTEADLHKKLYEIDMRDGVLDGQNKRKAMKCPRLRAHGIVKTPGMHILRKSNGRLGILGLVILFPCLSPGPVCV